jgi:hypothetical protein
VCAADPISSEQNVAFSTTTSPSFGSTQTMILLAMPDRKYSTAQSGGGGNDTSTDGNQALGLPPASPSAPSSPSPSPPNPQNPPQDARYQQFFSRMCPPAARRAVVPTKQQ